MIDISFDMSDLLALLTDIENHLPNAVEDALQECGQIVDSSKDYAQYLEYGRGPVTAIKAKALRFIINGEVIFRKSVGPMKAQPFVHGSIIAAQSQFNLIFQRRLNKLVKR